MKKLVAKLFIVLVVLVGVPSIGLAKTNSFPETVLESSMQETFRVGPRSFRIHSVFLKRGEYRFILSGDGDTDLDLQIFDDTGLIGRSENRGDDEVLTITVRRPTTFAVKVINYGYTYNDYVLYYR